MTSAGPRWRALVAPCGHWVANLQSPPRPGNWISCATPPCQTQRQVLRVERCDPSVTDPE